MKVPAGSDKAKEVLAEALRQLYAAAAKNPHPEPAAFLQGGDGTFLGNITENAYDVSSITNAYGPFGSRYSPTSIHNPYSPYASSYSQLSMNNVYATNPPILYLANQRRGRITTNHFIPERIDPDVFMYLLTNKINAILTNQIPDSIAQAAAGSSKAFLMAADDTYLGNLNPNRFDANSVFNRFGRYGSKFSPTSIYNEFGTYGSKFSNLSPFNSFTKTPPTAYIDGKAVAVVTVNKFLTGYKVDPDKLEEWARQNVGASY